MRTLTLTFYVCCLFSCSSKINFTTHKVGYQDLIGTSWEKIDSSSGVQQVSVIKKFEDSIHFNWTVDGATAMKFRYYLDTSTNISILHILDLYDDLHNDGLKRDASFLIRMADNNTLKMQWPFEKNKWNNNESSTNTDIMKRKQ